MAEMAWKVASAPELAAPAATNTEPTRETRESEGMLGVVRAGASVGGVASGRHGPRDPGALTQEKFATQSNESL